MTDAGERERMVQQWPLVERFESRFLKLSDATRLRLVEAGPREAPSVLMLHGAPQMALCWRPVMRLLKTEARLIAPDLRGYGASDLGAPGSYSLERLVQDIDELVQDCGGHVHVLCGHDWGGVIAWRYAETHPERVGAMVLANAPHVGAYLRDLRRFDQLMRSWYVLAFQLPWAERLAARHDARWLMWMMQGSAKGLFDSQRLDLYRAALSRPGRAEAVLAYYRAALPRSARAMRRALQAGPITMPTVLLWGERDVAISRGHPDQARRLMPTVQVQRLPQASHWVPEQCPEQVAEQIRRVLGQRPRRGEASWAGEDWA